MNSPDYSLSTAIEFFDNAVFAWGLIACGVAQLSKLIFEVIKYQRWRPAVLLETGGMPSSHSALVTGTAAGVGLDLGFNGPSFAIAATLALVVMYDASGIRRSSGLIAAKVNEIPTNTLPSLSSTPLKENLGHTRLEVFVGSLIGPAITLPGIIFLGSPIHIVHLIGQSLG